MNPWDAALLAASDQIGAAFRTFAQMSRKLYDAYREENFTHDEAFDVVMLWNETFSRVTCISS